MQNNKAPKWLDVNLHGKMVQIGPNGEIRKIPKKRKGKKK